MTKRQLVLTATVWAVFAGCAAWRSPIPGINEPHYLCKAKHFSDPSWCAGDFFIASANAHWVFYAVSGPLTRVFSLEQTAWIGRIVVWGLLAWGWVRLVGRIVPGNFSPLWSAAIFLAFQATGNLSGEWLIGGVEAKGFAYAGLMLAMAAACDRSWVEAGIEMGLAISFHPLVGIWGLAALAAAIVAGRPSQVVLLPPSVPDELRSSSYVARTSRVRWLSAVLCVIFSLPGLIPAIAILTDRPPADKARIADGDQVFYRLKHHLDPMEFSKSAWMSYAGLLVAWLALRLLADRNAAGKRLFAWFVIATVGIAAGGAVAGFWLRSPGLMKFYPFRLVDLFLPIAVAITVAGLVERAIGRMGSVRRRFATACGHGLACAALAWSVAAPGRVENPSHWPADVWTDFLDVCDWINRSTPPDAVFLTPKYNVGFKWHAQRAEYATWKDCPQDAAGILEWARRINRVTVLDAASFQRPDL